MPLTPQGKTFSARQKQELPLPYGLPAGRGTLQPCAPPDLYVLHFYDNAASLVLPARSKTYAVVSEGVPYYYCGNVHVYMHVCMCVLPWAGTG